MSESTETTHISVHGTQPGYFTMLPNMAIIDLSANAYKLLAIYIDTAKTNQVYSKNSTLSDKLGVTPNTMKKTRKELSDKGYVTFAIGKSGADTTTARVVIQLNWMWAENNKRMSNNDTVAIKETENNELVSEFDRGVSNSDTNNKELKDKELKDKELKVNTAPPEKTSTGMYETIQEVFSIHGGMNVDYQKFFAGTATKKQYAEYHFSRPVTPDELIGWSKWYRKTVLGGNTSLSMVTSPAKIQSSILEYRRIEKPSPNPAKQAEHDKQAESEMQILELIRLGNSQ